MARYVIAVLASLMFAGSVDASDLPQKGMCKNSEANSGFRGTIAWDTGSPKVSISFFGDRSVEADILSYQVQHEMGWRMNIAYDDPENGPTEIVIYSMGDARISVTHFEEVEGRRVIRAPGGYQPVTCITM